MTRRLFDSSVIICVFISIQCQGWLSGRSGSEALGSEALIRQSTVAPGVDGSKVAAGLKCTELKGDGLGLEVLGWFGSNALGSEALAGEALAS